MQTLKKLLLVLLLGGSGCVSNEFQSYFADLSQGDPREVEVRGYLKTDGGELELYPRRLSIPYKPYAREEKRCVSILPAGTIITPLYVKDLHGKQVIVRGRLFPYDEIPIGSSDIDKINFRRYYNGNVVMNFCLRRHVLIANEIEKL